jgi:nucleoside-diphosphate-sugar epimerase
MRRYGLSARLAEGLCQGFTARTGIATVGLRPVAVWEEARYRRVRDRWRARPASEWEPVREYGAFVDGRDVAAAVGRALTVPLAGHHRALLCAPGLAGTAPSLELAARLAPHVPVTGPAATAPIPGPPSSTAQPPPPHSAANPPTTGHSTAQTPAPSHNNPRGRSGRLIRVMLRMRVENSARPDFGSRGRLPAAACDGD